VQVSKFNQLIKSPFSIEKESLSELQQLVRDFPYFQSAHILLNIAAKRWDGNVYQKHLKKTAIIVSNRTHLFELIQIQENNLNLLEVSSELKVSQDQPTSKVINVEAPSIINDVREELNIHKATEIAHVKQELINEEKLSVNIAPEILESEIVKELVAAIVDKEIINQSKSIVPEATQAKLPETDLKPDSFSDWLAFLKKNNGQPYQQIQKQVQNAKEQKQLAKEKTKVIDEPQTPPSDLIERKLKNRSLIDKIIDTNPGSIKIKEEQKFYVPDTKAKESLLENEHLVTETLAKIYALQGNIGKAIRAYQILSLKFPQKSVYFATLIQKLKNNE
jgi:hypothetical protein